MIPPFVRTALLCEGVTVDPVNPHRIGLSRLVAKVRPVEGDFFPVQVRVQVYLELSSLRFPGTLYTSITYANTSAVSYIGLPHYLEAVDDPLVAVPVSLVMPDCFLDAPGLYWVDVWYDDKVIAELSFVLEDVP